MDDDSWFQWGRGTSLVLTHWGQVTHICVGNLTIIASENGLSPGRRQAIIWTNAGKLIIWPLGTNFGEISIEMHTFSFKKRYLKMSSGKGRPFCLCLNVASWWRRHSQAKVKIFHLSNCLKLMPLDSRQIWILNIYISANFRDRIWKKQSPFPPTGFLTVKLLLTPTSGHSHV